MSEDPGGLAPLRWQSLVDEARRRRKAEGLTQREHAALANVSVPTLAAFDRGETTLTLAKAFDILRVVGLVEEPGEEDGQDAFVSRAFTRWRVLTADLPPASPAAFSSGWYRIDYCLEGDLKPVRLAELATNLAELASESRSSLPMFRTPRQQHAAAREIEGVIECWLALETEASASTFIDPANFDFWQATPAVRLFFIRGYREDFQDTFRPGTLLDTILPIRALAEGLSHACRLGSRLARRGGGQVNVRFRARYSGLGGRVLRAWSNPFDDLIDIGHAAHNDDAFLEIVAPAKEIENDLAWHVHPMVASLYERFGINGPSLIRIRAEIDRFTSQATPPAPKR